MNDSIDSMSIRPAFRGTEVIKLYDSFIRGPSARAAGLLGVAFVAGAVLASCATEGVSETAAARSTPSGGAAFGGESEVNRPAARPTVVQRAPIPIDVPADSGPQARAAVTIGVGAGGLDVRFSAADGRERGHWTVAPDTTGDALVQLIGPAVGRAESPNVVLYVDRRVRYGDVVAWMDALRRLGWTHVSFAVTAQGE